MLEINSPIIVNGKIGFITDIYGDFLFPYCVQFDFEEGLFLDCELENHA